MKETPFWYKPKATVDNRDAFERWLRQDEDYPYWYEVKVVHRYQQMRDEFVKYAVEHPDTTWREYVEMVFPIVDIEEGKDENTIESSD